MPEVNLKGKTILVIDRHRDHAGFELVKRTDANVVIREKWLGIDDASEIAHCVRDVEESGHKVDALIIAGQGMGACDRSKNIEKAILETTKQFKDSFPVIVSDSCRYTSIRQPLQDAGAKFLHLSNEEMAVAVADAIVQHGKPGRKK